VVFHLVESIKMVGERGHFFPQRSQNTCGDTCEPCLNFNVQVLIKHFQH
jgi:hypothetical protein